MSTSTSDRLDWPPKSVFSVYAIGVLGFRATVKTVRMAAISLCVLLGGCTCSFALNPSLDISQYAHTSWTARDGFSLGNIFAMAQTPDGYLWLGSEFTTARRGSWLSQKPAGKA
jgi:hypothetical protein